MAKNLLSNPGRALDIRAKIATAAASRNSKQAVSTLPELITFYNTEKGLYLGSFVEIMVKNWSKKLIDYTICTFKKNIDLEQRLEKKLNDVNSFHNHINNNKEMITYFKDKNNKSKKRYKNYKTQNTILESVDSILIIGATSTSITLSITGIDLIVSPISAGIACTLSLANKILPKIFTNKYNKNKKQYERDQ